MKRLRKDISLSACSLLFFIILILSGNMFAQYTKHHRGLDEVLNSDGSIKSGVTGSFNPKGYELKLDQDGKPMFQKSSLKKASTSSSVEWNSLGTGRLGISNYDGYPGNVYTIAINSDGDIYVGGLFGFVGDIEANNIAKWDVSESKWVVLPCGSTNGVGGSVETIKIKGTDVYAAGTFLKLRDETQVNCIAKFSETANEWSALTDVDGSFCGVYYEIMAAGTRGIFDMDFMDDVLYVGGYFYKLGDGTTAAYRVAKWDGTDWYPVTGSGANGVGSTSTSSYDFVDALEVSGNKVYVGGYFATLGNAATPVNNIAVFDETSDTWSSLTYNGINGIAGYVYDIKIDGATVYVGGEFTKLGDNSTTANNIAKWVEGSGWSPLTSGGGSTHGVYDIVISMLIDGANLYVCGDFTQLDDGSGTYNYIAKWDGSNWSTVANNSGSIIGVAELEVCALGKYGDNLYIGGTYMYLGDNSTAVNSLSVWNTTTKEWAPAFGSGDNGVDDAVRSVVVNGDYVYVGGYFNSINGGTLPAKKIARWNYKTNTWSVISSLTKGIDQSSSQVFALAVSGNYLYVGGVFGVINGGTIANNIARYDLVDGTWSQLSDGTNMGVNGKVATIAVHGDEIYVGGYFTTLSGGATANRIAKWNESTDTWSALTDGVTNGASGNILCSAVNGNRIYFGGNPSNLACWDTDTQKWITLTDPESTYPSTIRAIAINGSDIYIASDNYSATIQKWDNTNGWTVINTDSKIPTAPVYALNFCGNELYAAGGFISIDDGTPFGIKANGIAKWNSTSGWQTLSTTGSTSTGVNHYVYALTVNPDEGKMYVGGNYSTAGGKTAFQIASFTDSDNPLPVELTSFIASILDKNVTLKWSTATEVNNYGFEVERASLGTTPGQGGNTPLNPLFPTSREDNAANPLSRGDESGVWERVGFVAGAGNSNSPKNYAFVDVNPLPGNLQYRLKQIDLDGKYKYYSQTAEVSYSITEVKEQMIPKEFGLSQNYPNPFNPLTVIGYQLPVNSHVTLKVYDMLGNEVSTLVNEQKQAGYYQVKFDGSNLASGVYVYRLQAGSFISTRKLMLMK